MEKKCTPLNEMFDTKCKRKEEKTTIFQFEYLMEAVFRSLFLQVHLFIVFAGVISSSFVFFMVDSKVCVHLPLFNFHTEFSWKNTQRDTLKEWKR